MEASSGNRACSKVFSKWKVDELKHYLRERGIQLSDDRKGKRKAELLDLCQKVAAMKQTKLDDSAEDRTKLQDKLQASKGKLPGPKTLSSWTHNLSQIPEFTFRDLYNYLVGKNDYSPENLRSCDSNRFKVHLALDCFVMATMLTQSKFIVQWREKSFCFFKFKVKPTERAKTEDGQIAGPLGSDGCCRHVTVVLFDLQSTVRKNLMSTCTSGKCEWKKTLWKQEYVNIVKAEFRKTEDPVMPINFELGQSSFDTSVHYEGHGQKKTSGIESPSYGSTIREGGKELLT